MLSERYIQIRKDVFNMVNTVILKENGLPVDLTPRERRLGNYPIQIKDNILVYDRLETEGILLLYEYIGGACYMPMTFNELRNCKSAVLIAGISISAFDNENLICIDKYFSYLGYEEYTALLFDYIDIYADFYGYDTGLLDLRKGINIRDIRQCKYIDIQYW